MNEARSDFILDINVIHLSVSCLNLTRKAVDREN